MSDSNLNQNTSEDTSFPAAAPETNASAPAPQSAGPEEEPKQKTFTRRTVLAMAGCGVAGLVVGGVLASWGVTSASIASGRIEIRTTPTKMIVTDRARCSGCQRCEMMCTLKNDGRVCQHIARVRVWPNYNFGASVDTKDGIYDNCEFTVEHCKQCADPACMNYCPVHAIYADEESGARTVDTKKCIGCYACEVACKMENDIALGERWNKVVQVEPFGEFPHVSTYWLPVMCQQCEESPCTHVCPTGASYRDEATGMVLVDKEKCIGCKYCMMACPYGVRSWNKAQRVVEKCTLCNHLTSAGELPACVKNCCGKARFYGDLDDPNSDVSKELAAAAPDAIHYMPDAGNGPLSAYILSPKFGEWRADDLTQTTNLYVTTEGSVD